MRWSTENIFSKVVVVRLYLDLGQRQQKIMISQEGIKYPNYLLHNAPYLKKGAYIIFYLVDLCN